LTDFTPRAMDVVSTSAESRRWWLLAGMGGVIGIVLLDETVVATALPTIRDNLAQTQIASHWVINAYLLVFAGFAAAGGKLGDLFGQRAPFLIGLALFGLGSMACGLAQSSGWLIAARALQGGGAAIIFPLSMAMVTIAFPPAQRGVALGIYGAIGSTFLALGPLVGGFFTELISWRWIFGINPPIAVAIAMIVLTTWRDPSRKEERRARIDFPGLITLVGGLFMVVFALMEGPAWGWGHPAILALFGGGGALLIVFVRVEARSRTPLIEVALFRGASFTVCNLVVFVAQVSKISAIVFGALYLQDELNMSPLTAGLALLPAVGPWPFMSTPSGRLADRYGARPVVLWGLALTGTAFLWLSVAAGADDYLLLTPGLLLWGFGAIILFAPARSAVVNVSPPEKHGQVGGIVMSAQILGGTIGMAVCGTLYATVHSFAVVFLATAGFVLAVLALGWRAIERPRAQVTINGRRRGGTDMSPGCSVVLDDPFAEFPVFGRLLVEIGHGLAARDGDLAEGREMRDLDIGPLAAHEIDEVGLADIVEMVRRAIGREAQIVARADRHPVRADLGEPRAFEDVEELLLEAVGVGDEALAPRRHPRQAQMGALHADHVAEPVDIDLGILVERMADVHRVVRRQVACADQMLRRVGHRSLAWRGISPGGRRCRICRRSCARA
jgi:EmrB/QacA subfamily drug resistance transporter